MAVEDRDIISLGADVGGEDAFDKTNEHILEFRKLLWQHCSGVYSSSILEFALVLRIDGSVQAWGKSGVFGVKLTDKKSVATADIYVTEAVWSTNNPRKFRNYIASEVIKAITEIEALAEANNVELEATRLKYDIGVAIERYLSAQ